MKHQKALDLIIHHLKKKGETTQVQAIELAAKSSKNKLILKVMQCLDSKNQHVRAAAAECLGALGHKNAVQPLCKKLADYFWDVRLTAAESLGILLAQKKQTPLALMQKLEDPNELVRIQVIESITAIGDKKALPKLWKAIQDPSPLVRSYAGGAIGSLGSKSDIKLLSMALKKERSATVKIGILQALFELGETSVLPSIFELLKSKDYRVRCAVANTLSGSVVNSSNSKMVLATLCKALRDESTVAARSTFDASIRTIRKRFKQKK